MPRVFPEKLPAAPRYSTWSKRFLKGRRRKQLQPCSAEKAGGSLLRNSTALPASLLGTGRRADMHWAGSSELTLSLLIGSAVKTTFVLTLAGIVARAMRNGSAAMRHHTWALGIVCSMAIPILTLVLPSWHSATLSNAAKFWTTARAARGSVNLQKLPSTVIDAATASPFTGQLIRLTLLLWALGALFVVVKLLVGLARLALVSAHSVPVVDQSWGQLVSGQRKSLGIVRPVQILLSSDPASMP